MDFTHLHIHTHYSLLDGMTKIPDLLNRVKELKMDAVAVTDHGNMYAAVEFFQQAKKEGIKPIIGCELYVAPRRLYQKEKGDGKNYHLIALVENEIGYKNLCKLVSTSYIEGFYYKPRVDKELLKKYHEGIIFSSACIQGEIPQAIVKGGIKKGREVLQEYIDIVGKENLYLEVQHHNNHSDQDQVNKVIFQLADEFNLKVIVTCDAHYVTKDDQDAHEVLLSIQTGKDLNDDKFTLKDFNLSIIDPKELEPHFKDHPEVFSNTREIVNRCNFEFDFETNNYPKIPDKDGKNASEQLREKVFNELPKYYNKEDKDVIERLNFELETIKNAGFSDYFLFIQDVTNFCKQEKIPYNTRGSAAGSIVSYLLQISALDPLKYDLFFERFLNPERIGPPDIDLDVADKDRQKIIGYISHKYGSDHVCQIITFGIMKARMVVRDVTRALGYEYALGDSLSKAIPEGMKLQEAIEESPDLKDIIKSDQRVNQILEYSKKLEGVARHYSIHAAGVIVTPEPLTEYIPIQNSAKSKEDVLAQYSKVFVEDIGLLKMDLLGLANLTIIKQALRVIRKLHNKDVDLDALGVEDDLVFEQLRKGNTTGVFQLESEGMTKVIKEMKVSSFEDLSAAIALYRPGPMQFIPTYIDNKLNDKEIIYLDPRFETVLGVTYGIMVYQEQLMQIANRFAGFSMGQADILRKAVGKKKMKLLASLKPKLIKGLVENGMTKSKAEEFWEWVQPFARYGFNKSHSISYARIAYQTAWLKTYYPAIYMAALLTNNYDSQDKIYTDIKDCNKMNIEVLPPSINYSYPEFSVHNDNEIYFGLTAIKNIGENVAIAITEERKNNGEYTSLQDFLSRSDDIVLNKKSLENLIKSGALDCLGNRARMANNLETILAYVQGKKKQKESKQGGLFGDTEEYSELPDMNQEDTSIKKSVLLGWEFELLGIYLTGHPLDEYKHIVGSKAYTVQQVANVEAVNRFVQKKLRICGMFNKTRKVMTKTGKQMAFSNLNDGAFGVDVVIFPKTYEMLRQKTGVHDILDNKITLVEGRLDVRNNKPQIICEDVIYLN